MVDLLMLGVCAAAAKCWAAVEEITAVKESSTGELHQFLISRVFFRVVGPNPSAKCFATLSGAE
jgi:hypothetical protein